VAGKKPGRRRALGGAVVVIGGANIDVKARIAGTTVPATSNPGTSATLSAGGVGRNIAHNLARLGIQTRLISIVGRDPEGSRLLDETARAGVDVSQVRRGKAPTGLYSAVLDSTGELVIGVSAMSILDELTPADLQKRADAIDRAAFVIADCNLRPDCLKWLLARTRRHKVPILIEPVSVPKAAKLTPLLRAGIRLHTMTPNLKQLEALAGAPLGTAARLRHAASALHDRGIENILVGLGPKGAALSCRSGEATLFQHIPAAMHAAQDVTGGGDALVAGYVAAIMGGTQPIGAAVFGQAAAGLAVASVNTVSAKIDPKRVMRAAAELARRM
jgi:pseudouridine kinase